MGVQAFCSLLSLRVAGVGTLTVAIAEVLSLVFEGFTPEKHREAPIRMISWGWGNCIVGLKPWAFPGEELEDWRLAVKSVWPFLHRAAVAWRCEQSTRALCSLPSLMAARVGIHCSGSYRGAVSRLRKLYPRKTWICCQQEHSGGSGMAVLQVQARG